MNLSKKKIRKHPAFGRMTLTKGQENILDSLWAKAVKINAGNKCERCHKAENLQSHHVIGRRNKTLRHCVSNGCCLCAAHHFWAEQNGVAFALWIIGVRGQAWWDSLSIQSNMVKVYKEYSIIKKYLEDIIYGR